MTPGEITEKVVAVARQLGEAQRDLATLDEAYCRAKAIYEVRYARAYVESSGEGNADHRKSLAVIATADERLLVDLAEVKKRAGAERLRVLHTQADLTRTLSASVRADMSLAGMGPGA